MNQYLLSLVIFIPLVGALLLLLVPRRESGAVRTISLVTMLAGFVASLPLLSLDPAKAASYHFSQKLAWIPVLKINYHVGLDGISLWLIILTTFLGPILVLSSYRSITEKVKEYHFCLLLLQTGMIGTFLARDMVLFYVFWELMLIPMYFLIGVWGGQKRVLASVYFFLYTMFGSVLMLVGILYIYGKTGSFALEAFMAAKLTATEQNWLFLGFALAFAIKVPLFPFHTWLPLAHVHAPTAGSVVLAGVLLKMGTYGLIRFAIPLFPSAVHTFAPLICILAVVGIIYGALVAMVQKDIKSLVAYSSVSHLGFVVLGLFALDVKSMTGGMLQMVNHGISTGALFLLVGMIYERRHTRMIEDYGGIARVMPIYAAFFLYITLSSIGLPGLNGFVGEFLILVGTFTSTTLKNAAVFAAFAATGVILSAIYMLWMVRRVFFGPLKHEENKGLKDITIREGVVLAPLMIVALVMGVFPQPFIKRIEPAVKAVIARVKAHAPKKVAPNRVKAKKAVSTRAALGAPKAQPPKPIRAGAKPPVPKPPVVLGKPVPNPAKAPPKPAPPKAAVPPPAPVKVVPPKPAPVRVAPPKHVAPKAIPSKSPPATAPAAVRPIPAAPGEKTPEARKKDAKAPRGKGK